MLVDLQLKSMVAEWKQLELEIDQFYEIIKSNGVPTLNDLMKVRELCLFIVVEVENDHWRLLLPFLKQRASSLEIMLLDEVNILVQKTEIWIYF